MKPLLFFGVLLLIALPALAQEKKTIKLVGDETPLNRVKADPKAFVGVTLVMTGAIGVSDYYNYGYERAQNSHYSFDFIPALSPDKFGEGCKLYLSRADGKDIAETILEKTEEKSTKHLRIRVKVAIDPQRFRKDQWELFELLDAQFAIKEGNDSDWGPWVLEEQAERTRKAEEDWRVRDLAAQKKFAAEKAKLHQERRAALKRTWTDESGKFSVVAEFSGVIGEKVRLKKENGQVVQVPLSSLSKADREWIDSRGKKK